MAAAEHAPTTQPGLYEVIFYGDQGTDDWVYLVSAPGHESAAACARRQHHEAAVQADRHPDLVCHLGHSLVDRGVARVLRGPTRCDGFAYGQTWYFDESHDRWQDTARLYLLQDLQTYGQRHPTEEELADRFITFINTHADAFERELQVGHITGSAWVVNAAGTHVLLTHHRKLDMWLQLGGHADGQTDVRAAARREVEEESGLTDLEPVGGGIFDLDVHRIPARQTEPEHLHWDIRYAFRVTGAEAYAVSAESHDLAWVPIAALADYTAEPSMHRMAAKFLALADHQRG